jgi:hypothetical protein
VTRDSLQDARDAADMLRALLDRVDWLTAECERLRRENEQLQRRVVTE